nr:hypothetical protein [Tanacetum cinerariifolium]
MPWYNHPGCSYCGGPFNGGNCLSCSSVGSRNEFVHDLNPYSYNETSNSTTNLHSTSTRGTLCQPLSLLWFSFPSLTSNEYGQDKIVSEFKDAFGNKQYKLEDIEELFCKLFNYVQNIHEELAEYIRTPSWNCHAFYNNDPIPSESEGIPDNILEEVRHFHPEDGVLEDDVLREKLSKINLLIAEIEALNANPTSSSDFVLKSPIPVEDGDSFMEKFETTPKLETFKFDTENSGSTTIHAYISLSDLECFYFKSEPDPGDLTSIIDPGIRENVSSTTNVNLPFEDDQSSLFAYVVWIFLPFLRIPLLLHE